MKPGARLAIRVRYRLGVGPDWVRPRLAVRVKRTANVTSATHFYAGRARPPSCATPAVTSLAATLAQASTC